MPTQPTSPERKSRGTTDRTAMRTLAIDIGGTGMKMLILDAEGSPATERYRERTPRPAHVEPVVSLLEEMIATQGSFDRVAVGFPGVVVRGTVKTAVNLDPESWYGFDLGAAIESLTGRPTRVLNDADMQGYGVVVGEGVELVLTLGTGLGSAMFVDGRLVPNLELGHHLFEKGKTYEELIGNAVLERIGRKHWRKRVEKIFRYLDPIFNYDILHVGGGNAKKLEQPLPDKARIFHNVDGLRGGIRLWEER